MGIGGIWITFDRPFKQCQRFLQAALLAPDGRKPVKRRKVPGIMLNDGGENRPGFIHPSASVELDTALENGFPWIFIYGSFEWSALVGVVTYRDYSEPSAADFLRH